MAWIRTPDGQGWLNTDTGEDNYQPGFVPPTASAPQYATPGGSEMVTTQGELGPSISFIGRDGKSYSFDVDTAARIYDSTPGSIDDKIQAIFQQTGASSSELIPWIQASGRATNQELAATGSAVQLHQAGYPLAPDGQLIDQNSGSELSKALQDYVLPAGLIAGTSIAGGGVLGPLVGGGAVGTGIAGGAVGGATNSVINDQPLLESVALGGALGGLGGYAAEQFGWGGSTGVSEADWSAGNYQGGGNPYDAEAALTISPSEIGMEGAANYSPSEIPMEGAAGAIAAPGAPGSLGTVGAVAGGGAAAVGGAAAASGSALERVLNGTASNTDWISLLGNLGAAGLGFAGASQASDKLDALARDYMALGAPSRERYEASFAPNFDIKTLPGLQQSMDTSADTLLRKLSATGGNPYGNPGGLTEAQNYITGNVALPALQEYRRLNAGSGGLAALTSAAPGAATGSISAGSGRFDAVGGALADITNPRRNLFDYLNRQGLA